MTNTLFYGDNLGILRDHVADESIDLIYLDPPFNSNRTYNVLFKEKSGDASPAQIEAFNDTWQWDRSAEKQYDELVIDGPANVSQMISAMRQFLGSNDMMAYLVMMAARLIELHRVLKPTGSLYLHCDPTASHYLKIVLDAVFSPRFFRNEIVWKRRTGSSSAVHGGHKFGAVTDAILFYTKTEISTFNPQYTMTAAGYQDYVESTFRFVDENGRRYRIADLANPAYRPNLIYEYKGYKPPANGWAISRAKMEQWEKEGRLEFPKTSSGRIQRRRFLDELKGKPVQNLWDDIDFIQSQAGERLGYPTQKPLALLERIISASSNPGDVVLDPFCGCGTAVIAAQKLGRQWIGIDVTHLAISLIKYRLEDSFPGIEFDVKGEPADEGAARMLAEADRYQFQWWALSLVKAKPIEGKEKKGADKGIDGVIVFVDDVSRKAKRCLVQVKSGGVNSGTMRDLVGTLQRENAELAMLVTLEQFSGPMRTESVEAGFYDSPGWGRSYPKVQIITIGELLSGKKPDLPPARQTFQQSPVIGESVQQKALDLAD
ncbi:site-specific DNA-methyltransferase [soil metagenome]